MLRNCNLPLKRAKSPEIMEILIKSNVLLSGDSATLYETGRLAKVINIHPGISPAENTTNYSPEVITLPVNNSWYPPLVKFPGYSTPSAENTTNYSPVM